MPEISEHNTRSLGGITGSEGGEGGINIRSGFVLSRIKSQILGLFSEPGIAIGSARIKAITNLSKSCVNYHLKGLMAHSLISKIPGESGLYELTDAGVKVVRSSIRGGYQVRPSDSRTGYKPVIRGHNIRLKVGVIRVPDEILFKNPVFTDLNKDYSLGWLRYSGRFQGNYFFMGPRSLIFQPSAFYDGPYNALLRVFELGRALFKFLEEDNPGLRLDSDYTFLVSQEYAYQGDELARAVESLGVKIETARFKIDFSRGDPELEFISPAEAVDDAEEYRSFTKRWIKGIIDREIDPNFLTAQNLAGIQANMDKISEVLKAQTGHLTSGSLANNQIFLLSLREANKLLENLRGFPPGQGVRFGGSGSAGGPAAGGVGGGSGPAAGAGLGGGGPAAGAAPEDSGPLSGSGLYELSPAQVREYWASRRRGPGRRGPVPWRGL